MTAIAKYREDAERQVGAAWAAANEAYEAAKGLRGSDRREAIARARALDDAAAAMEDAAKRLPRRPSPAGDGQRRARAMMTALTGRTA